MRFPGFEGEWENRRLSDIAEYRKERTAASQLIVETYISTENMLPDYQGVFPALNIPSGGNVSAFYPGDVLLSNIRPYLKKVWRANVIGGCSTDVMVFKAKKCVIDKFLYYIIANDSFINYAMAGAKGVKMPRGDKEQLMKYELAIPSIDEQCKIASLLTLIDQRITIQNKIIGRYQSLIRAISKALVITDGKPVKLGDIAEIYQPRTISVLQMTSKDKYPVYGANGIIGYYSDYNHATEQICIACRGNTCGVVNYSKPFSWITGNSMVINVDQSAKAKLINKRYLFHLLSTVDYTPLISGSGQPQIVRGPLRNMQVVLPCVEKQILVAQLLDAMVERHEMEKEIMSRWIAQKQTLLHQIFI